MKTTRLPLLLAGFLSLSGLLHAQNITTGVPGLISYQGRVLGTGGVAVGTGTPVNRTVIFRVWDHPTNTALANLIYSEQQTVTIADGKFSVLVGQGVATLGEQFQFSETPKGPGASPTVRIANAFNGSERYLGVTVAAGASMAATDSEIGPRQQIVSSAFAFRSKYAETLGTNNTTALTVLDSGNIGVGNTTPPARFTVTGPVTTSTTINPQFLITDSVDPNERLRIGVDSTGNGSGFLQSWKEGGTGATNLLLNPNGGNVGIGTTSPQGALDVEGYVRIQTGAVNKGLLAFGNRGSSPEYYDHGIYRGGLGNLGPGNYLNLGSYAGIAFNTSAAALGAQPTRMFIDGGSGNVGIGTTTADAKLRVLNSSATVDSAIFTAPAKGSIASHLHNGPNGDVYWRSASSAGIVILQDTGGNVGIGTSAPGARLTIGGHFAWASPTFQAYGGVISGSLNTPLTLGSFVSSPAGGNQVGLSFKAMKVNADTGWGGTAMGITYDVDGVGPVGGQIWMHVGNVGIGTASPTVAKLVVSGTGGSENLGAHYTYANTGVIAGSIANNISGISIKASDAVHAAFYRALSDARIKVIEGVSNGVADLAILNRIEITDYTHKDVIGKGKDRSKKVIAQQVETVFPQAVSKSVDVVPDIYQKASIAKGWIALATDLKKGERVRLINDLHDGIHEVLEVKKDRFLTSYRPDLESDSKASGVTTAMTPPASTPKDSDKTNSAAKADAKAAKPGAGVGQVFVFGREVNDVRAVDYEAISMLNVSATQELSRQVKQLAKENADLKAQLAASQKRFSEMDEADEARDAKLAAIEKLLQNPDKSAVRTVGLQKGE